MITVSVLVWQQQQACGTASVFVLSRISHMLVRLSLCSSGSMCVSAVVSLTISECDGRVYVCVGKPMRLVRADARKTFEVVRR